MTPPGPKDQTVKAQFARNLIRCRADAGLNQEDPALWAGMRRTQVSLLEHVSRTLRIDTLVKLAGGPGVSAQELLDGMTWQLTERREGVLR